MAPQLEPASELHRIVISAHDIAPTTRERYLRDLNQWTEYAGTDPKHWTRRKAAAFYDRLIQRMKPQSANRLMASVAYASRWWAHYENNADLDFARVQTARAKDKKPQQALTPEMAVRLLATCDRSLIDQRDFAMIVVGLETGMRRMSLASMMLETTSLDDRNPLGYPATLVDLKGRDPGWVPLSDTAVVALRLWLEPLGTYRESGPVFRSLSRRLSGVAFGNTRLSQSTIVKIFADRSKAAGLQHINPHLMRHTFVTWRTELKLAPHEIASITHHDITKSLGALGGYMDAREIGGRVRNSTPGWLADLVRERIG